MDWLFSSNLYRVKETQLHVTHAVVLLPECGIPDPSQVRGNKCQTFLGLQKFITFLDDKLSTETVFSRDQSIRLCHGGSLHMSEVKFPSLDPEA